MPLPPRSSPRAAQYNFSAPTASHTPLPPPESDLPFPENRAPHDAASPRSSLRTPRYRLPRNLPRAPRNTNFPAPTASHTPLPPPETDLSFQRTARRAMPLPAQLASRTTQYHFPALVAFTRAASTAGKRSSLSREPRAARCRFPHNSPRAARCRFPSQLASRTTQYQLPRAGRFRTRRFRRRKRSSLSREPRTARCRFPAQLTCAARCRFLHTSPRAPRRDVRSPGFRGSTPSRVHVRNASGRKSGMSPAFIARSP